MGYRGRISFFVLAVSMGMLLVHGFAAPVAAQPNEEEFDWRVNIRIDYPDLGVQDTTWLIGHGKLKWFDPYASPLFPPHLEVDSQIDTVRLFNPTGSWAWNPPGMIWPGKGFLLDPEPTIESFFDVTFEIGPPKHDPLDTLRLMSPVRTFGRAHGWPPLFDKFETLPGMPPVPMEGRDGLVHAFLLSMEYEMIPHYEPEVHLSVSTAYASDVAIVGEDGLIRLSMGLSGDYEATEAIFSRRLAGDTGPFMPFHVDMDGSAPVLSTIYPEGTGDGWSANFDPGSDPFDGCWVEFEGALLVPPYGMFRDTVLVFVDPTPPIPSFFDIDRDSIPVFEVESFFDVTFDIPDELPAPMPGELWLFPLKKDFERALTPVDQLGLGTPMDTMSCGPAGAASCLKYFADNGYPGLDNVGGDEAKPQQSAEDIARELQGAMGTNKTNGTKPDGAVAGIDSYLKKHGQSGWTVEHQPVDDATDLAEMIREFESDGEDVLVILEDVTAEGDTMGHLVTLGSTHSSCPESGEPGDESGSPTARIDFMDPYGGGLPADNDYPLDTSGGGRPTTEGYDLDDEGADAEVAGYIKVSPPEGGPAPATLARAAAREPWILAAAGPVRGHGLVDTLHFDTAPFPGGLYLMEIVTIDDQGFRCRDIRLAGIPEHTTGSDLPDPGGRTMLRGSYPNPFNPTTTIEFFLASGTKVTLAIYDVAGRRVRTLISDAMTEPGLHKIDWNGKDDGGRSLASGVYFASFRAEGQVEARKLILLR